MKISNLTKARESCVRNASAGLHQALSNAARRKRRKRRRPVAPHPAVTAPRRTPAKSAASAVRDVARCAHVRPAPSAASARHAHASRALLATVACATHLATIYLWALTLVVAVAAYCDSFEHTRGSSMYAASAWVEWRPLLEIRVAVY